MKGLFKSKPKTPVELVKFTRELLIYANRNTETREKKHEEKLSELSKLILEIRTVLLGSDQSEPNADACEQLANEFFREDTLRLLIFCLPKLQLGKQRVDSKLITCLYLENNLDSMDILILGYEDGDIALTYGAIAREYIRHQSVGKYLLGSRHMKKFFGYPQNPNFDVASDGQATFKKLLTRHKLVAADILSANYDWLSFGYNVYFVLCFLTTIFSRIQFTVAGIFYLRHQGHAVKVYTMNIDRSNSAVMVKCLSSLTNSRILKNLLRFEADKALVIREIATLEPSDT